MEQYFTLSRENQAPAVVKPKIRGNINFEIKSQFMQELREDTFSGNKNEDAHDHVDRVLNIVSLFNIPRVSQDAVLLRVFPFTLTGSAKRWVDRLTPGVVNTWDLLKKAFIQRYCPPSKTAKRLEDIHNFKQESDESLYQAWERYNDLLYKCPTHDINSHQKVNIFYKGLSTMNCQLLDWQGPIPGMTPTQALAAIKTMTDHSQKWHDGTSSRNVSSNSNTYGLVVIIKKLQENGKINTRNQSASFKNLETQIEQLTKELKSRTTNGAPSSSTKQCKVVNVDHETPHRPISSRKLNNLHGVFDVQRDKNKEERTTYVLQCQLPPKELNPRNFTLPCTIVLKTTNLRNTNMLVEMDDMTKKAPLVNELCGYVRWKPSRDFTRPLGPPSGFKGLLHTLNAIVIPKKVTIQEADLEHGLEHAVSSYNSEQIQGSLPF
ncbi:hypothetical protein Tco_1300803 [Tanacetum coccineum]